MKYIVEFDSDESIKTCLVLYIRKDDIFYSWGNNILVTYNNGLKLFDSKTEKYLKMGKRIYEREPRPHFTILNGDEVDLGNWDFEKMPKDINIVNEKNISFKLNECKVVKL